ncbi:MAG: hypothetical protein Q9219_002427 [cf. Caloplaca sp. 3 TL-2023]
MANASDIITYIGVPLAVIGVLPIFYTFINSFFTLRNIKRSLRRCGLEATTRGSYMGGVIEVSLPRFSITPLDRTEDEYWTEATKQSTLKGGSWTILNWNQLITNHALQRVQYSSDLKIPQAEIDLEELFEFLLDRGAMPDPKGIHMLRVSGLWTPTGTCLMFSPDTAQTVLRISSPDESDGILSLALQWKPEWNRRDHSSLPPGWMRLKSPLPEVNKLEKPSDSDKQMDAHPVEDAEKGIGEHDRKESLHAQPELPSYTPLPDSLRFQLSSFPAHPYVRIRSPIFEYNHLPLDRAPVPFESLSTGATSWLAPLCLVLGLSNPYPSTFLAIPSFLHAISLSSSIPCGVLVIANLLSPDDAPDWETTYPPDEDLLEAHEQFIARQQAMARERILPEEQRVKAHTLRRMEELSAMNAQAAKKSRERKEREDRREREALVSQKMGIDLVMNAALRALQGNGDVAIKEEIHAQDDEQSLNACQLAVEHLLVGIYRATSGIDFKNNGWALDACRMLERWRDWAARGGLNRDDLQAITADPKAFCWAAVAVGLITKVCEKEKADGGGLLGDVRECLRVWKKVRLG